MTSEEVKKELDKIPEKDVQKIKSMENLSDEELMNVAGGMSKTTKKVLKGLAFAGATSVTAGISAWLAHNAGYSSGYSSGTEEIKKAVKEARKDASKKAYHIGYQKGVVQGVNDEEVHLGITMIKMMSIYNKNNDLAITETTN